MKKNNFIIMMASYVATIGVALAAEYFVSPTGNDEADGSVGRPWRTIQRAASAAIAGDVVTIRAGIYREWVKPANAGRADAPIVYRAEPGEKVVITGSDPITEWSRRSDGLWEKNIPYDTFGGLNPFTDFIQGAWFSPKGRNHFRTRLIQNGEPLELHGEDIYGKMTNGIPKIATGHAALIPGVVSGTIYAAFKSDPNVVVPELVVRPACFYALKTRRDYIVLRNIVFRNAGPQWGHPRGEQAGIVGSNWSRGWIIEDCEVSGSSCAGITLGKCANDFDAFWTDRKQSFGLWGKRLFERDLSEVGHHIVRRCRISDCGQAGICGAYGAAFSLVEDCEISYCHWKKPFEGAEMAGIKFHAPVDSIIRRNRIHHNGSLGGIWIDWMGQGTCIQDNVLWANQGHDIYLEVNHGPILFEGNDMLSKNSVWFRSNNVAIIGNRIYGNFTCDRDEDNGSRKTPTLYPHSMKIKELFVSTLPGNFIFINNLMPNKPDFGKSIEYPCRFEDNWYVPRDYWKIDDVKGTVAVNPPAGSKKPVFKRVDKERLGKTVLLDQEFPECSGSIAGEL